MTGDDLPTPDEIIATHDEIVDAYDLTHDDVNVVAPRLKLRRLLEDVADHDDTYGRAAQLLRDLVTSHYFEDGNKRTAWMTTRDYLDRLDEHPAETGDRVPHILRRVRRYDDDELAEWLRTGDIDETRLSP